MRQFRSQFINPSRVDLPLHFEVPVLFSKSRGATSQHQAQ
jgi:hypothetical protein